MYEVWWSYVCSRWASNMEQTTSNNPVIWHSSEFQEPTESSLFLMDHFFLFYSSWMWRPWIGLNVMVPKKLMLCYYYFLTWYFVPWVLNLAKVKNVCLEWLWWRLRNCERVGKAHCIETLNCHWNTLVKKRSFPHIGCATCGSSANFCYEAVSLVWQGPRAIPPLKKNIWVAENVLYLVDFLADMAAAALSACSAFCDM